MSIRLSVADCTGVHTVQLKRDQNQIRPGWGLPQVLSFLQRFRANEESPHFCHSQMLVSGIHLRKQSIKRFCPFETYARISHPASLLKHPMCLSLRGSAAPAASPFYFVISNEREKSILNLSSCLSSIAFSDDGNYDSERARNHHTSVILNLFQDLF